MDDIRVDAELIRGIAKSLRTAATHMHPEYDRPGAEDRRQEREGRGRRRDTLDGARTAPENFGDFQAGHSMRKTYMKAQRGAVETADDRARAMRRYARQLERCLQDLEDGDELSASHFKAIGKLTVEAGRR